MSSEAKSFHKTRIAPTPSGFLHRGNLYSFLLTEALAKKTAAKILLRIDDLDADRVHDEYVEDIFDTLSFMGIGWQEGPKNSRELLEQFSQKRRMALYESALQKLRDKDLVFACNCSRAQVHSLNKDGIYPGTCRHKNIPLDSENVSWRLKTPLEKLIKVKLFEEEVQDVYLPTEVHDIVIRRKDKLPAYQLVSVADDAFFGVDLIIRGKDLWPSTLVQLYLAEYLDITAFKEITFSHHDLLLDEKG
ncbi:MAG: tRNA glutamyl-Q synthetase, partial [Bacteroidia bacterium]|nr:tRNA glutamyl-Q synthetase [Bacteroidia bacterium]